MPKQSTHKDAGEIVPEPMPDVARFMTFTIQEFRKAVVTGQLAADLPTFLEFTLAVAHLAIMKDAEWWLPKNAPLRERAMLDAAAAIAKDANK